MIVERIAAATRLSPHYVRLIARTASYRYKVYQIPKKSGGMRVIAHPARVLKLFQYWLIENVLSLLPVHPSATAYAKHTNIRDNAAVHCKQNFLLRIDFKEFFTSIGGADVDVLLAKNSGVFGSPLSGEDRHVIRQLVCRRDALSIGAPSSPIISNAVMFELDSRWYRHCRNLGVVYTRYADDIYCSTGEPEVLAVLLGEIRRDLAENESPRLVINETKTTFVSRKRRKLVTGLVVTPEGRVSLGRKRKRYIRGLVCKYIGNRLEESKRAYLRGFIAYAQSVDAAFVVGLIRKYGGEVIDAIRRGPPGGKDNPTV